MEVIDQYGNTLFEVLSDPMELYINTNVYINTEASSY